MTDSDSYSHEDENECYDLAHEFGMELTLDWVRQYVFDELEKNMYAVSWENKSSKYHILEWENGYGFKLFVQPSANEFQIAQGKFVFFSTMNANTKSFIAFIKTIDEIHQALRFQFREPIWNEIKSNTVNAEL